MDENFVPEADPLLRGLITKKAGAAILQDMMIGTYWANTVGKTKAPGVYHLYKKELNCNLQELMGTKMSYRQIEDFLVTLGYEIGDIRCCFQKMTGLDPVKLEYMRTEDVKTTPSNIPWYNLGWGWSKSKKHESYFVMPHVGDIFTVFGQKNDMEREEVANFLRHEDAVNHLKTLVKRVHRYDMPAEEQVDDAMAKEIKEPTKHQYHVMANYLYDLQQRGELSPERVQLLVRDAVLGGTLTDEEGETMISVYAADEKPPKKEAPSDIGSQKELEQSQKKRNVKEEVDSPTPQKFFDRVIERNEPDRMMDEVATKYVKSVLSYIKNKTSDIMDFDVRMHSLEYRQHPKARTTVEVDPETGAPVGSPKATISVILEISDRSLPEDKGKKFALSVFFVGNDGDVTTSDSIKGEDDIIYGFSEDGMRQYFAKERSTSPKSIMGEK